LAEPANNEYPGGIVAAVWMTTADHPYARSISSFRKWVAHEMHGS
jgi:hypothetical protein